MELTYQDFYALAGVRQHAEFEAYLKRIVFDKTEREAFYTRMLEMNHDVKLDSFKPYFEIYAAERKSFQQDYTPDTVAILLAIVSRSEGTAKYAGYDATAGTGALIIHKWASDRSQESPWSYAPHRYIYRCDELADNVIPYLIHNLAMRGMNAIVVHGDTLTKQAKQVYFIQNSKDDFLAFSDVNVMPHSEATMQEFDIVEWLEDEIDHVESSDVIAYPTLPMKKKDFETADSFPEFENIRPWEEALKLKEIAEVERSKKGKIYKRGGIIVQMSATRGQVGLLESDGEVESKYAVIQNPCIPLEYLFQFLKYQMPRWFQRVQQGLNVPLEAIEDCPVGIVVGKMQQVRIKYGQLELF